MVAINLLIAIYKLDMQNIFKMLSWIFNENKILIFFYYK